MKAAARRSSNDDASSARRFVAEGDATFTMFLYMARRRAQAAIPPAVVDGLVAQLGNFAAMPPANLAKMNSPMASRSRHEEGDRRGGGHSTDRARADARLVHAGRAARRGGVQARRLEGRRRSVRASARVDRAGAASREAVRRRPSASRRVAGARGQGARERRARRAAVAGLLLVVDAGSEESRVGRVGAATRNRSSAGRTVGSSRASRRSGTRPRTRASSRRRTSRASRSDCRPARATRRHRLASLAATPTARSS